VERGLAAHCRLFETIETVREAAGMEVTGGRWSANRNSLKLHIELGVGEIAAALCADFDRANA
jgi:hypothetical protein